MVAPVGMPVSAKVLGDAFVEQYYHILQHSPWLLHRFYQDNSTLGRPEEDGSYSVTTTINKIKAKLQSLNYGDFRYNIISADAQESLNGGANILVIGYMTGKDNIEDGFAQSFFLAPLDRGYFVLNDIFRYTVAPETSKQEPKPVPVLQNNITEQASTSVLTKESQVEKVIDDEHEWIHLVKEESRAENVVVADEHGWIPPLKRLGKSYQSYLTDLCKNLRSID